MSPSTAIAVVGLACRLPAAPNPDAFWRLLRAGRDAITDVPRDRWVTDGLSVEDQPSPGLLRGGFLDRIDEFDAEFFGISPKEAAVMDPQQRLALELSWEALEDAGIVADRVKGSQTGVFVGAMSSDYGDLLRLRGATALTRHALTGTSRGIIANRVSYTLGLQGPSLTIDAAQASALVAVHLACESLREGEATLALAGGVSINISHDNAVSVDRLGALSPDGRCFTFDSRANGYVRGEGGGVVALKLLTNAIADGDEIHGVICGTAVNNDGGGDALTAPDANAQKNVLRRSYRRAGIKRTDIQYVELHGTGTRLGDQVEATALGSVLGAGRGVEDPVLVGSAKTNVGHLEGASGIVGLIKTILCLAHREIPASLNFTEAPPEIPLGELRLKVQQDLGSWPAPDRRLIAGVSSFGMGGTNCHVVVAEAPPPGEAHRNPTSTASLPAATVVPWVLSGKTEAALRDQARNLRDHVEDRPDLEIADIGYSLVTSRCTFERRAVVVGSDREQLLAGLAAVAQGESAAGVVVGQARSAVEPVFVFPGQGSQWPGMAVELLESSPVFADSVRACAEAFSRYVEWSLEDVLRGVDGAPAFERVDVVQPALFAVMVSLAAVWRSWGVRPSAVVGHSQGEIAAAYVAGGLSLDDAARIVTLRSRAVADQLAGRGAMASVALAVAEVEARIAGCGGRLSVAAVNGPASVVVSGEVAAVEEWLAGCERDGVWVRRIPVDYASHSVVVEEVRERLGRELASVAPRSGSVAFVSTVTGAPVDTAGLDGAYWYRNLRERVRFDDVVRALIADGATAFVEMSPHPGLTLGIEATATAMGAGEKVVAVGSLRRGEGDLRRLITSLAEAHVRGVEVDWTAMYAQLGGRRVELPRYAFQRERYWLERGRDAGDLAAAGLTNVDHPMLSAMLASPTGRGAVFTGRLSLAELPWLADHAVFGRVLFPATAFVELVLTAGANHGCGVVEELTLEVPLLLAEGEELALQVVVGEDDDRGGREVAVYSQRVADSSAEWVRHASGVVIGDHDSADDAPAQLGEQIWPPAGAEEVDVTALYDRLADAGFDYGPLFQGTVAAWRRGDEMFCEVVLAEQLTRDAGRFGLHPALLDASFHATIDGLSAGSDARSVPLPFAVAGVRLYRPGASSLRVQLSTADDGHAVSLRAVDHSGRPVLELESLAMRAVDGDRLGRVEGAGDESLFRHEWVEIPLDEPTAQSRRYAVLGADDAADAPRYRHLDDLLTAIERGADVPDVVLAAVASRDPDADAAEATRDGVVSLLSLLQTWLASEACRDSRLVVVTRGAMSVTHSDAPDPAGAALWGLVRSAQSEHPGRFMLVDLDDTAALDWPAVLATDEPQLAVRRGAVHALRVARLDGGDALAAPAGDGTWYLDAPSRGTLDALALVESSTALNPLGPEQVRIAVRAGGLNFRDVLIALGQYPDDDPIGSEGAGVVLEVGEAVTELAVGDRVMGLMPEALGPVAVTDRRLVACVPTHWSNAEAASVPIVFMTAYYGLVELAELRAGETVLVHAGAGGVGMAAIQIARHLGADVYATASPEKWGVLRGLGLDDDHIASSRDLEFRDRFLAATAGKGVDVVLNALAREFVDASLELLPRGGRFIEMGKSDIRDRAQIRLAHPGVAYRAYDLMRDAGRDRVAEMLAAILTLFEAGALRHLPLRAWDVRHAVKAFRHLGDGRNVGKVVLTIPRALDPAGTVLITGGTGDLGARVARHLARKHGVSALLLVSRRGPDSPGATELIEELRELGADPRVVACDVADRDDTAALLGSIDAGRPLTAVIHTAGVLDDSLIDSLTPEQVDRVLRPKVDAALVLHELTRGTDLAEFVLFSSDSGTIGVPGQGNYAAANVCLDALADLRRAQGMPGKSLAWGLWSNPQGMARDLGEADIARLARLGVATLSGELELFDIARGSAESVVVPSRLDMPALRASLEAGTLPPLMRDVVRGRRRRGPDTGRSLQQRLANVPEADRERAVLDVVCAQIAVVLGHGSAQSVDPERKFKELGFDSLSAVELRNRLAQVSGLRLPSTLIFDHPSPGATTRYLVDRLSPAPATDRAAGEADIGRLLASISIEQLRAAGLLDSLVRLAGSDVSESHPARSHYEHANGSNGGDQAAAVENLDLEELVQMARRTA